MAKRRRKRAWGAAVLLGLVVASASGLLARLLPAAMAIRAMRAGSGTQEAPVSLVGDWSLNLARTHYGPGVDRRRRETFSCTQAGSLVRCRTQSIRLRGGTLSGGFAATLDGPSAPVTGIPSVDAVQLRRATGGEVDATFSSRGRALFGYRAFRSDDARSLVIVSVDPLSRVVLSTVVVYDRR